MTDPGRARRHSLAALARVPPLLALPGDGNRRDHRRHLSLCQPPNANASHVHAAAVKHRGPAFIVDGGGSQSQPSPRPGQQRRRRTKSPPYCLRPTIKHSSTTSARGPPPSPRPAASLFSELSQIEEERVEEGRGEVREGKKEDTRSAFEPVLSNEKEWILANMRFPSLQQQSPSAAADKEDAVSVRPRSGRRRSGRGYRRVEGSSLPPPEWAEADEETRSLYASFAYYGGSSPTAVVAGDDRSLDSGMFTGSDAASTSAEKEADGKSRKKSTSSPSSSKKWLASIYKYFGLSSSSKKRKGSQPTSQEGKASDATSAEKGEVAAKCDEGGSTKTANEHTLKGQVSTAARRRRKPVAEVVHRPAVEAKLGRYAFGRIKRFAPSRRREDEEDDPSRSHPSRKLGRAGLRSSVSQSTPTTPRLAAASAQPAITPRSRLAVPRPHPSLVQLSQASRSALDLRTGSPHPGRQVFARRRSISSSSLTSTPLPAEEAPSHSGRHEEEEAMEPCKAYHGGYRTRVWLELNQAEWVDRVEAEEVGSSAAVGRRLAASTGSLINDLTQPTPTPESLRRTTKEPPPILHLLHVCEETCDFQRGLSAPGAAAGEAADVLWYRFLGRYTARPEHAFDLSVHSDSIL